MEVRMATLSWWVTVEVGFEFHKNLLLCPASMQWQFDFFGCLTGILHRANYFRLGRMQMKLHFRPY
jgi:hypothetical protein